MLLAAILPAECAILNTVPYLDIGEIVRLLDMLGSSKRGARGGCVEETISHDRKRRWLRSRATLQLEFRAVKRAKCNGKPIIVRV